MLQTNDSMRENGIDTNYIEIKCSEMTNEKISVVIGGKHNRVVIEDGVEVVDRLSIHIEDDNNVVYIGKGTTFEETSIAIADSENYVIIGEDCMFARNVRILASDFHAIVDLESGRRRNVSKGVIIDNHVWVGYGSIIKKNTHIYSNSVISAGIVVQGVVYANSVFTGKKEKIRKKYKEYTWERCRDALISPIKLYEFRNGKKFKDLEECKEIIINVENNIRECFNKIEGWAFWNEKDSNISEMYVRCIYENAKKEINWIIPLELKDREDVAQHFQNEKYLRSGFKAYMPATVINNWDKISAVELIIRNELEIGKYTLVKKS